MYMTDLLSRLHLSQSSETNLSNVYHTKSEPCQEIESVNVIENLPIADSRIKAIQRATLRDTELQCLINYIIMGFPQNCQEMPSNLHQYFKYMKELSTQNGFVFKGHRILIPSAIRNEILERLHYAHNGIEMTTKLARDSVFWPGITNNIRNVVSKCEACHQYSANIPKLPMMSIKLPNLPFEIISMDIMKLEINGKKHNFLITVDHY